MFYVNIFLALFNLLPAFPMDGGRVLRAFLAMRTDHARATRTAAHIGQAMALLFGLLGVFSQHWMLVLVALFIWMGAAQEAGAAQMRSALGDMPVTRGMITNFQTLHPLDPLSRAVEYLIAGFQHDFPVVDSDQVVGVLTRDDLAKAIREHGSEASVGQAMRREFVTADPRETIPNALARLQQRGCHTVFVVQNGRLIGLVTAENLAEVFMIEQALRERKPIPGFQNMSRSAESRRV